MHSLLLNKYTKKNLTYEDLQFIKKNKIKGNKNNTYIIEAKATKLASIMNYCTQHDISYEMVNYDDVLKNETEIFIRNNPPHYKKAYFCAYCGRFVNKTTMKVTRLYPNLKNKVYTFGIENVYDIKNLVATCSRCYRRKGKKTGLWVIKGLLGKNKTLWYIRHVLKYIMGIFSTYLIVSGTLYRVIKYVFAYFGLK